MIHRGETVAPGIAVGPVHLRGFDDEIAQQRVAADQVEEELNRLRGALQRSRAQIEEIKQKQQGSLGEAELRIFDAHIAYLSDPMLVAEIEQQVLQERFAVREAIRMVVAKYDRIFQLVESDLLRRRASDLRDVATRLMRNLAEDGRVPIVSAPTGRYILAASKLTTADMFNIENERVDGIVAEEGGLSSHAAILARSMGIPTLTGIRDLPRILRQGGVVVLDAGAGELHVELTEAALTHYAEKAQKWKLASAVVPEQQSQQHETRDGIAVKLLGSCGSPGESELSRSFGLQGIGVFRTELPFLAQVGDGAQRPTEAELVGQYQQVLASMAGKPVNFRLLDVAAATLDQGQRNPERNPAMGARGVRGLFLHQDVLRLQLRAILRAAAGHEHVAVLVPFVTSAQDLLRVKSIVMEERVALRKARVLTTEQLLVAPIIEVPAAALVLSSLLVDADFAVVALDDLQAHLLAADRDNSSVREYHELLHPALFDLLARMARDAEKRERELVLFGESAADPTRMPFYLGTGYRAFSIAPVRLRGLLKVMQRYSIEECRRIAVRVLEAPRPIDLQKVLVSIETD
ncbi:phosphoenolpyruvate-protein phosphotransferase [Planctomycetota bacterium]|nr:phosphoenolpyruvate-protein phosphotransferase [Planctomycetota bacterium]